MSLQLCFAKSILIFCGLSFASSLNIVDNNAIVFCSYLTLKN